MFSIWRIADNYCLVVQPCSTAVVHFYLFPGMGTSSGHKPPRWSEQVIAQIPPFEVPEPSSNTSHPECPWNSPGSSRLLSSIPLNDPVLPTPPSLPPKDAGKGLGAEGPSAKRSLPVHKHHRQIKNGKREIKTFKVQTLFGAF